MPYYSQNTGAAEAEKRNHRKGFISSIIFHLLLLLLLWLFGLPYLDPPPPDSGILVNLGFSESGFGDTPPEAVNKVEEIVEEITPPESVVKEMVEAEEEVLTQENEVTATIVDKIEEKKIEKPKEKPVIDKKIKEVPIEEVKKEVEKEQPKVNQQALFKGRESSKDKEGSQGITSEFGDQGKSWGKDNSDNYGEGKGLGDSGIGYNLGGRKHVSLPKPNDNSQAVGTVVIRIKVDQKGNVLDASYQSKGSNTTNATLVQAAIEAAKRAKFEAAPNASEEQFGSITYHFKVE